jgi:hypothetical protein
MGVHEIQRAQARQGARPDATLVYYEVWTGHQVAQHRDQISSLLKEASGRRIDNIER